MKAKKSRMHPSTRFPERIRCIRKLIQNLLVVSAIAMVWCSSSYGQVGTFEEVVIESDHVNSRMIMRNGENSEDCRIVRWRESLAFHLPGGSGYPTVDFKDAAPEKALMVAETGIGVGTNEPMEALHIYSTDSQVSGYEQASILLENNKLETTMRTMLQFVNNGPSRMILDNTDTGEAWTFSTNANDHFNISRLGTGGSEFAIRKDGSMRVGPGSVNNLFVGASGNVTIRGTLNQQSDRNAKEKFQEVDADEVLDKIARLPITTWKYKSDDDTIRHIGPMAQDFRAAFGLGQDEKTIATVDSSGVAMAAIQALAKSNSELKQENSDLATELNDVRSELTELQDRLASMEAMLQRQEN